MPIIVVGGIKGGSGKTTIASNLAVVKSKNSNVLLIDADEQRSASDWVEHRESLNIDTPWTTISLLGASVRTQIQKLEFNYTNIIVDTGGRDTTSQRAALTVADVFVVPFQPKSLDIWTIGKVASLINEIRSVNPNLKVCAFLNRADIRGSDNEEAIKILKEFKDIEEFKDIVISDNIIHQRKAFSNAAAEGLGVIELKKQDLKATSEIMDLSEFIFSELLYMTSERHDTKKTSKRRKYDYKT